MERSNHRTLVQRARRLASSLGELGVRPGDRVGTFAWNSARHLELYLTVPALGAVFHTINIRLHREEIRYIIEHAGDCNVFADASVRGSLPNVAPIHVLMPNAEHHCGPDLGYEDLIAAGGTSSFLTSLKTRLLRCTTRTALRANPRGSSTHSGPYCCTC